MTANKFQRREAVVTISVCLCLPALVLLTGPWHDWQPWLWLSIVGAVTLALTGERIYQLLSTTPRSAIDPVVTGIGAAAASLLIWPGHWWWPVFIGCGLILGIGGRVLHQSTRVMLGHGQLKTLVDVANTIARSVRVETLLSQKQRLINVGSRLVIAAPAILWSAIFIHWSFVVVAAVLTVGILCSAQLRRYAGEWAAVSQIVLMLGFMLFHEVTPFVAINWAVIGIASTWPLIRYPRLGPDWGIGLALLVIAAWWPSIEPNAGASNTQRCLCKLPSFYLPCPAVYQDRYAFACHCS